MTVVPSSNEAASVKRQVGSDPFERGERHDQDFYRTGTAGTRALLAVESFPGVVWEPACGSGDMSEVLMGTEGQTAGITEVISSDLYERGFGIAGHDFLDAKPLWASSAEHVVTNPPFRLSVGRRDAIAEFARQALDVVPGKVALIGRLQWLEGVNRKKRVFEVYPPSRVWVFPWRCPMARGDLSMRSGLVAFAWFVWSRDHAGPPQLGWLP